MAPPAEPTPLAQTPTIDTPGGLVPTLPPDEWLRPEDRVAILTHGQWGVESSGKTGIQVLRYATCTVAGVVEPGHAGADAAMDWGLPQKAPVPAYATLADLLDADPDVTRVLIGTSPSGGRLAPAMRSDVRLALEHGLAVLSPLHVFLSEDPEFGALARRHDAPIVDLRRTPPDPVCASGVGRLVPVPVVATYGTDARCGKMTVSVALRQAAAERGLRAAFVATGQTGLLLAPDSGAPIDRVISDFAAGEVERQVVAAARLDDQMQPTPETPDLILVEGQGALTHPAFGAVTLAVLHGSWPDALLICHAHDRREKTSPTVGPAWPVLPVETERHIAETMLGPITGATTAAVALATPGLSAEEFEAARNEHEAATGLPVSDVLREGGDRLLDALLRHIERHPNGKRVPEASR